MMLFSFASCFESIIWALVFMSSFLMVFALFFLDVGLIWLDKFYDPNNAAHQNTREGIIKYWAGLWPAMRSLVFSLTGGADYGELMEPWTCINPLLGILYIFFIMTVTFGLLNVLVGIFVQESEKIVHWDRSLVLKNAIEKRKLDDEILSQLYCQIDRQNKGSISLQ